MYRILIVKSKKKDYASLYQYLTTTDSEDNIIPVEFDTIDELDEYVENMLNEEVYSKNDFEIVKHITYTIDAKDYSDDIE